MNLGFTSTKYLNKMKDLIFLVNLITFVNGLSEPFRPYGFRPCQETEDFNPVCGSDGETYDNASILKCISKQSYPGSKPLFILHWGPCEEEGSRSRRCIVDKVKDPVCGSDGQTFDNPSVLRCANKNRLPDAPPITVLHFGECGKQVDSAIPGEENWCFTTRNFFPVCGSNGETYDNPSVLICANIKKPFGADEITMKHPGRCNGPKPGYERSFIPNSCTPSSFWDPVCGNDGNTYRNREYLECANKRKRPNQRYIDIVHYGECQVEITCFIQDDFPDNPVCGSDGISYSSPNALYCANEFRKEGLLPIGIAYYGACSLHPEWEWYKNLD